jgi:hypothetical protein
LGPKFADIEEKYDLTQVAGDGFSEKDDEGEDVDMAEEGGEAEGEEEL